MYRNAILCALLGAVGGALAFYLSRPFLADVGLQNVHPNYTLGSVFGWLSHGLLGGFITASISAVLGYADSGSKGSLRCGLIGFGVGTIAGWGSDALYDWLMIRSEATSSGFGSLLHILWSLFVCTALSIAIFLSTGAKSDRILRCLVAAGIGTIVGFVAREMANSIVLKVILSGFGTSSGNRWEMAGRGMLVEYCTIGLVLGAVFGLVEAIMQPARLRLIFGRNEWRTWSLNQPSYRIGANEPSEIRAADLGLAPEHARLVLENRRYCIQDAGPGMLINGFPMSAHWLIDGDLIQLGNATFFYGEGQPPEVQAKVAMPSSTPSVHLVDPFGNRYALNPGTHVIGRDPSVEISVAWDSNVSRRHAEIQVHADQIVVTDLGSRNGTNVDGKAISGPVQIQPGSQILIGSTLLVCQTS